MIAYTILSGIRLHNPVSGTGGFPTSTLYISLNCACERAGACRPVGCVKVTVWVEVSVGDTYCFSI